MATQASNPPPSRPPSEAIPSSFDSNPDFFEEKRLAKLGRRLREEPLIPLGCAATVYALYLASKSIRAGDHHRTNRMFRARIYAQGFTLLALVGGSIFWKDDRVKQRELEVALEARRSADKKERWLRELEERDREDREWRARFEDVAVRAREAEEAAKGRAGRVVGNGGPEIVPEEGVVGGGGRRQSRVLKAADAVVDEVEDGLSQGKHSTKRAVEKAFQAKSVLEHVEASGWGRGMWPGRDVWRRRR